MNARSFHEELYDVSSSSSSSLSSSSSSSDSESMDDGAADICSRSKAHRSPRRAPRSLVAAAEFRANVASSFSDSSVVVLSNASSSSDSSVVLLLNASSSSDNDVDDDVESANDADYSMSVSDSDDDQDGQEEKKQHIAVAVDSPSSDTQKVSYKSLQRLNRVSGRYFQSVDVTTRCFNCGEVGHVRDHCTAPKKRSPCFLCGQLGHNARRCDAAAGDPPTKQFCWLCSDDSHATYNCCDLQRRHKARTRHLHLLHCYVCGTQGHFNCCAEPISSFGNSKRPICCNCGKFDHTFNQCTQPRLEALITREQALAFTIHPTRSGSNNTSNMTCFRCGEVGHTARQCGDAQAGAARAPRPRTLCKRRHGSANRRRSQGSRRRSKSLPAKMRSNAAPKVKAESAKLRSKAAPKVKAESAKLRTKATSKKRRRSQ